MKNWKLLAMSSLVALAATGARAQTVTDIASDTQPGFDTGTTVATNGATVTISGGEVENGNLFHSFANFDLASGDIANWVRNAADAPTILNIINRVRSASPSEIDGTLRVSDMPNASFWFINPAGVIFGDGAAVDVPGSAHFSTAHEIVFADGARFSTVTPDGSTFSSAPPQAFGFLGGQGRIDQSGSFQTENTNTASVSFVAADLRIDGAVFGEGSHFDFAAVGADAQLVDVGAIAEPIGNGQVFFTPDAFVNLDSMNAAGGLVVVEGGQVIGNGTGDLRLRANEVIVEGGGAVLTENRFGEAGDIIVEADFVSLFNDGALRSFAGFDPDARGGDIRIFAEFLNIDDGGRIFTQSESDADGGNVFINTFAFGFFGGGITTFGRGNGATGAININAFDLFMPGGRIDTRAFADGPGGDVNINAFVFNLAGGVITTTALGSTASGVLSVNADTLIFSDRGILQTQAAGTGGARSGALIVNTNDALFFGGEVASAGFNGAGVGPVEFTATGLLEMTEGFNQIATASIRGGDAGDVTVRAGEAVLQNGAVIESFTDDTDARSGNISVDIEGQLSLSGDSSINSLARGAGEAGDLTVSAAALTLSENAHIQSFNEGTGDAGLVTVSLAGDLLIERGGFIESVSIEEGSASDVRIEATNAAIIAEAFVRSISFGSIGDTGQVVFDLAGDLLLSDFAAVESSNNGLGNAGDVLINARNAKIEGNSILRSIVFGAEGASGAVRIDLSGAFNLMGESEVESTTLGLGDTGGISIAAESAHIGEFSRLQSGIFGSGTGGSVRFDIANELVADGSSTIGAFTQGDGDGGDVIIRAADLLVDSATISADVFGEAEGGTLDVDVTGSIRLSGTAFLATISELGQAGDVVIRAGDTLFIDDVLSSISGSASVFGSGGSVFVEAPNILIGTNPDSANPGGRINSVSQGASGPGGDITVITDNLVMNTGQISASALLQSRSDAGSVTVEAGSIQLFNRSDISASTFGNGDAGTVRITADEFILDNSFVSSITDFGPGNAGTVIINAGLLRLIDSEIRSATRAFGDAGTVDITADRLEMAGGLITSLTLGEGNAGDVIVRASEIDVTGGFISSTSDRSFPDANGNFREATGDAGSVSIFADNVSFSGRSGVAAATIGEGEAGDVLVRVTGELNLSERSFIAASTAGSGNAGVLDVAAGSIALTDSAAITSGTGGAGSAGDVLVAADSLALSGEARITSRTVEGSTGQAGRVTVNVAGDLSLADAATIAATTESSGDAGLVRVNADGLFMTGGSIDSSTSASGNAGDVLIIASNAQLSGDARINSSALRGSTGNAGNVEVEVSGQLDVSDEAAITAATLSSGTAGFVRVNAGTLVMTGGAIASSSDGEGDAGDVEINAGEVSLLGDARVNSAALSGSTGAAGRVTIASSGLVEVSEGARIAASTLGPGDAGQVLIDTALLVIDGGEITSFTSGSGDAGLVLIRAEDAFLTNGATINSLTEEGSSGDAGGVGVEVTGMLAITNDEGRFEAGLGEISEISASTFGTGNAGIVVVDAGNILMRGGNITSATSGPGFAGDVDVSANTISLLFNSSIDSRAELGSSGGAGDVFVEAIETLRIEPEGSISASSEGTGDAGRVEVKAGLLDMVGGAINSFTAGSGDAGLVGVFVDRLNITGGRIDSASDSAQADAGRAGSVFIDARSAFIGGSAEIDSVGTTGNAGDVTVEVFGKLEIDGQAQISAATLGSGRAGIVLVSADEIEMTGGQVNSFTQGSGDAGEVDVIARVLTVTGGEISSSSLSTAPDAGDAGAITVRGNGALIAGNAVIESRGNIGNAGDVTVETFGDLTIADDAQISVETIGSGAAGVVQVVADSLTVAGGTISSVTKGSGDAGLIEIIADEVLVDGGRITSASEDADPIASAVATTDQAFGLASADSDSAGDAGDILVRARLIALDNGASIDSTSQRSNAGTITLENAESITLDNGSEVSTAALGGGDAGDITLFANTLLLDNFSRISSTAAGAFSAGAIGASSELIRIDNGSSITTNSENGPAGDIALFLPRTGVLGLAGRDPGVITTSSGANTGGRITIANPFLILAEGSQILALGEQGGANVQIASDFFIRSSDTVNLVSVDGSLLIESNVGEQITGTEVPTVGFLDASGILSGVCSRERELGEVSEFSSRVTGPYSVPGTSPSNRSSEGEGNSDNGSEKPLAQASSRALSVCL